MKLEWTILVDTREQQPLLFPTTLVVCDEAQTPRTLLLRTVNRKLETADYAVEGPSPVLIERKKNLDEVCRNCLTCDRTRFIAELIRLQSCPLPFLLLEGDPFQTREGDNSVGLHALLQLLCTYRVTPLFLRATTIVQRRTLGTLVAHLLIAGATHGRHHSALQPAGQSVDPRPGHRPGDVLNDPLRPEQEHQGPDQQVR